MWFFIILSFVGFLAYKGAKNIAQRRSTAIVPSYDIVPDEVKHRKRATELKRQKRFREAAAEMWLSFKALQKAGSLPSLENLYRYPKYLFMAGDYAECTVACEKMAIGEPFGNTGVGFCDCQRTRMFYSLAAEAYEAMGYTEMAHRMLKRVDNAGSDNQIHVDRRVKEFIKDGYRMAIVSDNCDSVHPEYEKFKGKPIRLTSGPSDIPQYDDVKATGLFADDGYPVIIQAFDELLDAHLLKKNKKK